MILCTLHVSLIVRLLILHMLTIFTMEFVNLAEPTALSVPKIRAASHVTLTTVTTLQILILELNLIPISRYVIVYSIFIYFLFQVVLMRSSVNLVTTLLLLNAQAVIQDFKNSVIKIFSIYQMTTCTKLQTLCIVNVLMATNLILLDRLAFLAVQDVTHAQLLQLTVQNVINVSKTTIMILRIFHVKVTFKFKFIFLRMYLRFRSYILISFGLSKLCIMHQQY